jgi:hypothetical protein
MMGNGEEEEEGRAVSIQKDKREKQGKKGEKGGVKGELKSWKVMEYKVGERA